MSAPILAASTIPSRRVILDNTAALIAAYVAPRVVTFTAAVVAARVLGATEFGLYTTAATIAVVASILASAGMQPLLIREIARAPASAPRLVGAAHLARVFMVLLMATVLAFTPLLGYPANVTIGAGLLGLGYLVGAFVDNLSAYFQGIERMYVWTQASALLGLVTGVLGIVAVMATGSLVWLCAAPVAGQLAALGWLLHRAPAAVRWPVFPRGKVVVALLRRLAPFAAAFIATTIYYRSDILILSRMVPASDVGLYGAAGRFLDVSQALALAGAGALLPHFARSRAASGSGSLRALGLVAVLAIPPSVLLFVLREPIVLALYGSDYLASVPIVALVAPAIVGRTVNMFALAAFAGADLIHAAGAFYFAAAGLSIALNLVAIPAFGSVGAAGVAFLTETMLAIALTFVLWRRRG
ncbi:MAG TPA: oligosaccharide flippase family protein [Longimicrobiaceae bacterium]|nr:oligosaccharide flippase family protein [Longimicrobiaceae bacterium]